jgi:hypothetical protein
MLKYEEKTSGKYIEKSLIIHGKLLISHRVRNYQLIINNSLNVRSSALFNFTITQ